MKAKRQIEPSLNSVTMLDGTGGHVISWSAHAATITTFDGPGSISTLPRSINPAGAITGVYYDASGALHGFLRSR